MERFLIEPIKVDFRGRDADEHRMDALLLGQSLSGIARVYNSIGHFYFNGQMRTSAHSEIRVQVGPPEPGSIFYLLYMLMVHGKMAIYPELLFSMAELAVPAFVRAIIGKKTGQVKLMEKALDVIDKQNERYHELVRATQENDMQTRTQLISVVQQLAQKNGGALADMAAPVGKTVSEVRQLPQNSDPIVIDAPTAEALRSPDEVVVGDIQIFSGVLTALDTKTGAFKMEELGTGVEFKGKITDPSLSGPQNIYSHALDTKEPLSVTAKPTMKAAGEVHKLFVSDAQMEKNA